MWEWEWPGLSTARGHRTFLCSVFWEEGADGAIALARIRRREHQVKVIVVESI